MKHRIATLPFVRWPTGPRRDQQTTSRQRWALLASLSPRPCSGHGAVGPCRSMKNRRCISNTLHCATDWKALTMSARNSALSRTCKRNPGAAFRGLAIICSPVPKSFMRPAPKHHGALRCRQAGIERSSGIAGLSFGASFIGFATASSVPGTSNP